MAQYMNYKNPPPLGPDSIYETWKNEVAIWRRITDLEKKKQGCAVALLLNGRAKEKVMEINVDELNSDNGLDKVIEVLDELYKKNNIDEAYSRYSNFVNFRKTDEASTMADHIYEYEKRYNKCKRHDMILPDSILAFKLLDSCGLTPTERRLVLTAAIDMKYETMKSSLNRIFGGQGRINNQRDGITVKEEALFTRNNRPNYSNYKYSGRGYNRSGDNSQPFNNRSYNNGSNTGNNSVNPLDRNGRRSRCSICQSIFHWARNCTAPQPDRERFDNEVKYTEFEENKEHITLYAKEKENSQNNEILMIESFCSAVIDTACTRTVCGVKWLDNFYDKLNDSKKSLIKRQPSEKGFRFGDGLQINSIEKVTLPAKIGQIDCSIESEVVNVDIPLLLSKDSLKRAGAVLDLGNDKATLFNQAIDLDFTSSGHYCVNIVNTGANENILKVDEIRNTDDKKKILNKLHLQFGHASAERLGNLLKASGEVQKETFELLRNIVDNCETCFKYKKPDTKPVVSLPLANDFNETVSVDLHELEKNCWYLHIIDLFTRFSAACIMRSKKASIFVDKFIKHWISIHGAPKKLFSDNGGEFSNAEVRTLCENFNIEIKTTAAESPWSNGIFERHNQTLTNIVIKIKSEQNCDWETCVAWAVMAKNSLINNNGFSPYQLVFGRNPNLPSVLVDKPPALEGQTTSEIVGNNISSMIAARKAFIETESTEKIRRAIRKQLRPSSGPFLTGEKVFYKRPNDPEWKGPGTVIGQDSSVIFVRHGGMMIRVHQSRLRKAIEPEINTEDFDENNFDQENSENGLIKERSNDENANCLNQNGAIEDDDNEPNHTEENILEDIPKNSIDRLHLRPGNIIKYQSIDSDEDVTAKIINRAGKVNGRNKYWYNVELLKTLIRQSVDLSKVKSLELQDEEICERDDTEENVMVIQDITFLEEKLTEIDNWKKNDVFKEIKDEGQKCISTRWVCTLKETPDGIVPKARLVARGFEEFNRDIPRDSPTCAQESLRMILAIMAQKKWRPNSIDIKTAFLQGKSLDRDVFIRPPKEHGCCNKIWHLQKCVYGLGDASLYWYQRVKSVMIKLGAKVSKVDPAVFYWSDQQGKLVGLLASHVDDFIWSGTSNFQSNVIAKIRQEFDIGKESNNTFQYIGIDLMCDKDGTITIHQNNYASNITPIKIKGYRTFQKEDRLDENEISLLRSKVGQLLWLARQSRPDIQFDCCILAGQIKNACVKDILEANKIIRRVKSEKLELKFKYLGDGELSLRVYSDASLANLADGGTQGGYLVLLVGQNGNFCPICWNSSKIRRVVRSTLSGETLAMADGIDIGIFISTLYSELMTGDCENHLLSLTGITDNKSLCDAIKSTKFVTDKRLRLEMTSIKEMISNNIVKKIQWCETTNMLADCLTKRGASPLKLLKALDEGQLRDT